MLHKPGMNGKIIIFAMLEDEYTIGCQYVLSENHVGNLWQFLEGVGRVGKDEIKLLSARLDESEYIATDRGAYIGAELLKALGYESMVVAVSLYTHYACTTSRHEFEGYAACAREEVEGIYTVKVDIAIEHIEDILLGKVCCGSGLESSWYIEVATLVLSCNYSHSITFP